MSALIKNNTLNSIIESKDNNILDLSNNINSLKITKVSEFWVCQVIREELATELLIRMK